MPKPHKNNEYRKESMCYNIWDIDNAGYTFILIENRIREEVEYKVRVFPHDDRNSYWMPDTWETAEGATWSILNYLADHCQK